MILSVLPISVFAAGLIAFAVYLIASKLDPGVDFSSIYFLAWIIVQASGILAIPCAIIGRLLNHEDMRFVNIATIIDLVIIALQVLFFVITIAVWCFGPGGHVM